MYLSVLRKIASKLGEGLLEFPSGVDNYAAHGMNLVYDRYWLSWIRSQWFLVPEWPRWLDDLQNNEFDILKHLELMPKPPDWDWHCKTRGLDGSCHPIRIQVIVPKNNDFLKLPNAPLIHIGFPMDFVQREHCVAQGGRMGDRIESEFENNIWRTGTIGGFGLDKHAGDLYFFSSGHVASQYKVFEKGRRNLLGNVVESEMPLSSNGIRCTKAINKVGHALDYCAVKVTDPMQVTPYFVEHVKPDTQIADGDYVEFVSKGQKTNLAKVAGLGLWREIDVEGEKHCYADLLVIGSRTPWIVNPKISRDGDSGAWICSTVQGHSDWYGVLIGGDGVQAFCSFSQNVVDDLQQKAISIDFTPTP